MCTPLQLLTLMFWKELSFLSLSLWHFDWEPELEIYQQRQVKQSKCLEHLCFYEAVVEQSLTVKLQFLHYPILKSASLRACYEDKTKFCQIVYFVKQLFCYFLFKRVNFVRGVSFSVILMQFLLCKCLNIQTLFVVHRSRSENTAPYKKMVLDGRSNDFSVL